MLTEFKVQFVTEDEQALLLEQNENEGKVLLEIQYLKDGNFLVFGNEPRTYSNKTYIEVNEAEFNSLVEENAKLFLNSAIQEAKIVSLEEENATILLELASIKGGLSNV